MVSGRLCPYDGAMTNSEIVYDYLTQRSPAAFCDDCLAKESGVVLKNQVNPITRTLALTRDFDRVKGQCSHCLEAKFVTMALEREVRTA
jgi:hypothetical protein